MGALFLTEEDVATLVDIGDAVSAVEDAFRRWGAGQAVNVPRVRAAAPGIVLHSMSAAAEYLGFVGWKNYTTTREAARFHVALYHQTSGELAALIEADWLGRLRTGAATGVAAQWMAVPEAREVGLFGAGRQAETQLMAITHVRPIERAFVYSRTSDRRDAFAERMGEQLGIEVVAADRPQEAAEDLPIVITATNSREPVFDGEDLAEGCFVAAMGSNWLKRAEIDTTVVRRADSIVCDSVEACRNEAGDFVEAIEKGHFDWSQAIDLADVVVGRHAGRKHHDSVCLFKSVGLAIEDLALAAVCYERASQQGVGRMLDI